ncbi:MAG: inorganic phosphate transporter family protein [Thermoplasmata archaeon]|nr:inorganic phosphate transporter family protein [Thermoplasmata archaeon]
MDLLELALLGAAFGVACSMGAHYTGACMGMPYAAGAIGAGRALALMAPMTLLGAFLASSGVEATVGHGLLSGGPISIELALAIVLSALVLTSLYNVATIPTSTIQILVFAVVGAGLAEGIPVRWGTVERLMLLWAIAPFAAFGLGYLLVRLADRWRPPMPPGAPRAALATSALLAVGLAASFAMGANDVANASGSFLMTGLFSPRMAALIGGIGLALGVLTWGRPLLKRVAFDLVALDTRMACGAQFAQAAVILGTVTFGFFTSMNQALVGALLGTGVARGQRGIRWRVIRGILVGWAIGPASGAALGFLTVVGWERIGGG